MIHGSCGHAQFNSPCMKEGRCSKYYPKNFTSCTAIDEEGYSSYRRRDDGSFIEKNGIQLENSNVVPYNPPFLMRYQTHVNIEYCNKTNAMKYLFKYVNKGPDIAIVKITKVAAYLNKETIIDEKRGILTVDTSHHAKQFGEYLLLILTIGGLLFKD